MKYTVIPKEYHRGYCPTICFTEEDAQEQLALMRKHTTFEWEIIEEPDDVPEEEEDDYEEENEGKPEFILSTKDCTQIYHDYAKAVEGYNLHCTYYECEGWQTMCKKEAKNEVTIDGVKVRAMRAVYQKGNRRREVEITIRIECD